MPHGRGRCYYTVAKYDLYFAKLPSQSKDEFVSSFDYRNEDYDDDDDEDHGTSIQRMMVEACLSDLYKLRWQRAGRAHVPD